MQPVTDSDFAYFLGLCVARGEVLGEKLTIRFRYRTREIRLPPGIDQDLARKSREYVIDTTSLKNRLESFFQVNIETDEEGESDFSITMPLYRESLSGKLIVSTLGNHNFSFKTAQIPHAIWSATKVIKENFLMGVADACSCPTYADRYVTNRCRVCLDIAFENWILPIQICEMFQKDL